MRDAKTGRMVESEFFQDVRFSSVDATSYQVGNKAFKYLRIKTGDPKVKIMQAKPDSNFKQIFVLPIQDDDSQMQVVLMVRKDSTDISSKELHRAVKKSLDGMTK